MATLNYATQYLQALLQEFPYVLYFRYDRNQETQLQQ